MKLFLLLLVCCLSGCLGCMVVDESGIQNFKICEVQNYEGVELRISGLVSNSSFSARKVVVRPSGDTLRIGIETSIASQGSSGSFVANIQMHKNVNVLCLGSNKIIWQRSESGGSKVRRDKCDTLSGFVNFIPVEVE